MKIAKSCPFAKTMPGDKEYHVFWSPLGVDFSYFFVKVCNIMILFAFSSKISSQNTNYSSRLTQSRDNTIILLTFMRNHVSFTKISRI